MSGSKHVVTAIVNMSNKLAAELMIMSGPDDGTIIALWNPKQGGEAYLIGRREDCDVILPYDSQISRQHARLFLKDDQWCLQDLGSRNGTYLGKQKIEGVASIVPGQMFRIGRTWLRLQDAIASKG